MRWYGPDALLFVGPTGVYLYDFFCSDVQFYLLLSPYLCFISLLFFDLFVLGNDALKVGVFHANQISMCLDQQLNSGRGQHRETRISPPVKFFTDRSKVVLLLWIFYGFFLSCVCYAIERVCLYVPCGHLLGKG